MDISSHDWAMRAAAFAQIRRLQAVRDQLTSADLAAGFQYAGARIPLVNPQRGIFKPRQMEALLSIRTVFPNSGAKVWYDDQRQVHQQEADAAKAKIAFSIPEMTSLPKPAGDAAERRYALRLVKQRLHQASFRDAVMTAYEGRCAVSGMPESMLLDAAHIIGDTDDQFGQPIVQNGLPLSKIHHAAFDAHLIGVDPDYRIHVSDRLLEQRDGPLLESIKRLHHGSLLMPKRIQDRPDRDRLDVRFQRFRAAA